MQPKFLERRVEILEQAMSELSILPAKVESLEHQVLQLRSEMQGEFSAVRREMADGFTAVRGEMAVMRREIAAGDEETRRFMRVLYEDVIARLRMIGGGT